MPDTSLSSSYRVHFIIIFLLISFNLRMSISAADPLLGILMRDLGLSYGSSGLFGLLPVMTLGLAAPLGARLVAWVKPRQLITYSLLLAIAGVIWRSYGGILGLYSGTIAIGLGLGIVGSVILGIVKQVFPDRVPALMGSYTACVCLGTSVGSGAANPIAIALGGWQTGLLFWALPLLLAAALWAELIHRPHPLNVHHSTLQARLTPLLGQKKAWMVSLFYLFRVAGSWLLIVWISTLMRRRGLPLEEAGLVLALATACEIPSALLSPTFSQWLGGRAHLMNIAIPLSAVSCWGLLIAPLGWWPLFSILFGLGIGAIFTIGMTLIVASSADEVTTVALSGMAQGIGFIAGGMLAWAASFCMKCPHPDIWMASIYTIFAFAGLYFGKECDRPGLVSVVPSNNIN